MPMTPDRVARLLAQMEAAFDPTYQFSYHQYVCRQCGALISELSRWRHWRWHQQEDNTIYQAIVLVETVEALWGDT